MHANRCLPLILCCLALVSGCDSLDPGPAFQNVRSDVAERTGHAITWNRTGPTATTLQQRVEALLADDLTVDRAVQVTLINNPRPQATYERLGIAQADVVQAGLPRTPFWTPNSGSSMPWKARRVSSKSALPRTCWTSS
jgi:cobalt-zinc-cadmium efflux system outer membrane protein